MPQLPGADGEPGGDMLALRYRVDAEEAPQTTLHLIHGEAPEQAPAPLAATAAAR